MTECHELTDLRAPGYLEKTFTSAPESRPSGRRKGTLAVSARKRLPAAGSNNDAFSHAVSMVAVPVLLGVLGAWIDARGHTRPLFLILLGALGVVGSFVSAYYRYEERMARHDAGKPWTRRIAR